ncbi:MAG: siderophore-interacting protein [Mycobacteriales bacterium]
MTLIVEHAVEQVRHELMYRQVSVAAVRVLTSRMRRVTFRGAQLAGFNSPGFDDHVKLFFPRTGQRYPVLPIAGPDGPMPPASGTASASRSYTPYRVDPHVQTLDIDMVVHGDGIASDWVRRAQPGDVIGIGGPRRSFLVPKDAPWQLMVGDETAIPAISRRLAQLPSHVEVTVVIEVADRAEQKALASCLDSEAQLRLIWLSRDGALAGTTCALQSAVREIEIPVSSRYVWGAGESRQMRAIRSYLRYDRGIGPESMRVTGYWTLGVANHVE